MNLVLIFLILFTCELVGNYASGSYDMVNNVFSPQGCLIQSDYAKESVKRGSTCVGIKCNDAIILAIRRSTQGLNNLMLHNGARRIYCVGPDIGFLPAGISSDGRDLLTRATELQKYHANMYGEKIPGSLLAAQIGSIVHKRSLRWSLRPYASAVIIASVNHGRKAPNSLSLHVVDSSGFVQQFNAYCIGVDAADIIEMFKSNDYSFSDKDSSEVLKNLLELFEGKSSGRWEVMLVKQSEIQKFFLDRVTEELTVSK